MVSRCFVVTDVSIYLNILILPLIIAVVSTTNILGRWIGLTHGPCLEFVFYTISNQTFYIAHTPRSVLTKKRNVLTKRTLLVLESEQALTKILTQIHTNQTAFEQKEVTTLIIFTVLTDFCSEITRG